MSELTTADVTANLKTRRAKGYAVWIVQAINASRRGDVSGVSVLHELLGSLEIEEFPLGHEYAGNPTPDGESDLEELRKLVDAEWKRSLIESI